MLYQSVYYDITSLCVIPRAEKEQLSIFWHLILDFFLGSGPRQIYKHEVDKFTGKFSLIPCYPAVGATAGYNRIFWTMYGVGAEQKYLEVFVEKSRIRETKNLSTNADSRTDTILERLRDLYNKKKSSKSFETIFLQNL